MSRLVSVVLVLGFVAQQFACCGVGICTAVCGGDSQTKQSCQAVKKSSCPCHHADRERHDDTQKHDDNQDQGSPRKTPHQHHVCIGTHLFYLVADRFDLAHLVMNPGIDGSPFDAGLNFLTSNSVLIAAGQKYIELPHVLAPQRSALCVYRI